MREGAIIAGATPDQMEKIYQFGKLTGYCFQIKDDLLDLTSDFQGLKKQTGNDIYEGKRTIMLAHLLRTISGSDKTKLDDIFSKSASCPAATGGAAKLKVKKPAAKIAAIFLTGE